MLQPPLDDPEDPGASLCAKPVTLRQILPQQGELFYLLLGSLAPTRVVSRARVDFLEDLVRVGDA